MTEGNICKACKGKGKCRTCRGRGVVIKGGGSPSGPCIDCRGTGECPACAGEGTLKE
jgi:hypothetical protein